MSGYFGTKEIEKVYIGSNLIYRNAPAVIEEIMTLKQVHINAFATNNAKLYLNDVLAKAGDIVYTGDVLTGIADDAGWRKFKFKRSPNYYSADEGAGYRASFEIKVSDYEYKTTLPKGYSNPSKEDWSDTYGFSVSTVQV